MLEFIKNLMMISVSADNVSFDFKWMAFWPVILFTGFVYWRAIKSFLVKK